MVILVIDDSWLPWVTADIFPMFIIWDCDISYHQPYCIGKYFQ